MILPFDYLGYKRLSENKRLPNHRWYSDATWGKNGWMSSIVLRIDNGYYVKSRRIYTLIATQINLSSFMLCLL